MKLNRANSNGSISVLLPKQLLERLGWKVGDYINISTTDDNAILQIKNMDLKK